MVALKNTSDAKLALCVEEAAELASLGRTSLYSAIKSGALTARKRGRRTVILRGDLQHFLNALPPVAPQKRNDFAFGGDGDV